METGGTTGPEEPAEEFSQYGLLCSENQSMYVIARLWDVAVIMPSTAPGKAEVQLELIDKEMFTRGSGLIDFIAMGLGIQESQWGPMFLDNSSHSLIYLQNVIAKSP